jgi:formamidopyrimidine-DNA glycosylase
MPELPEVETIRRQLAPLVERRRLLRMEILDSRWSRPLAPEELTDALIGRRVESLGRRGKYLVWRFAGEVYLVQHLRMTGAILCEPSSEEPHVRVRLTLGPPGGASARARADEGERPALEPGALRGVGRGRWLHLAIVDPRRFGTGELLLGTAALEAFFAARLGLEPLDERFTSEHLRELARGRSAPIKALLLDQRRIAGAGNIYANEALFRACIHPLRPAGRLSPRQRSDLREGLIRALRAGIDAQGASIDDFRHLDGLRGYFQEEFLVHGREGEPCVVCGTTIVKLLAAGRASYVCEVCQPPPRRRRKTQAAKARAAHGAAATGKRARVGASSRGS